MLATNGMNLEGYGPIATGMGGASMAHDNGTAAMMNNPATLGLMDDAAHHVDVALGVLAPNVSIEHDQMGSADSDSDSFMMPAVGWVQRKGDLTYGAGVFSQGGMGAEYASDTFMSAETGQKARSELGVGRLMFPVSFKVDDRLSVGGSLDYVWGGLDMMMPMPITGPGGATPGTFADFLTDFGGEQVLGEATMTAGMGGGQSRMLRPISMSMEWP